MQKGLIPEALWSLTRLIAPHNYIIGWESEITINDYSRSASKTHNYVSQFSGTGRIRSVNAQPVIYSFLS